MSEPGTVFEWLNHEPKLRPPVALTVERTTQSKFQFYLMVRNHRQDLKLQPQFFVYSKQEADTAKAIIEEHSVFSQLGNLYVLEGFSRKFVDNLQPAPGNWILAETDEGELKITSYYPSQDNRRAILRVLMEQLRLKRVGLTLRGLLGLDWSGLRSFEDYEPILRRAMVNGESEEDLAKSLAKRDRVNFLAQVRHGSHKEILLELDAMEGSSAHFQAITNLAKLIHFRALKALGGDDLRKLADAIGANYVEVKQLDETNSLLTDEHLRLLTERTIRMDRVMFRVPEAAVALYYFNSPISIRKR